ncbi:Transglycosylase-associated protein [Pirellula staleyi DSM 6068]|uniref:Transglycosylase-associated protein n=1 Tax=Pirellula staleyi (strain ATCC 27377 / DSM 6068 / ICPB 4128) TaxID=530564 RepID=D2QY60_PIRSD|nr:GlsB/YeaQ/YmgE family stress response membrane protein [Pirellula staleyi]ADB16274.1 Transglycosylase-associated protein [Pirellula staleyi DSM 6068]
MGILAWIIFGLLAGIVAKWIMPGNDPGGWIITILLGIAGAFVGGFVGSQLGFAAGGPFGFNWPSFGLAILGSLIILAVYRLINNRRIA